MPRRKLAHVSQQCAFAGAPKVGEIIAERFEIQTGADPRNRDQRFQLRGEGHAAAWQSSVIERLHAKTVSRDEQLLFFAVPNRESENAAELLEHRGAEQIVKRSNNRRVGVGVERISTTPKVFPQGLKVVYLAIEDNLITPPTTRHGLRGGRARVDNGQAAMRQSDPGVGVDPYSFAVGASMRDIRRHPAQEFRGQIAEVARDAAHGQAPPSADRIMPRLRNNWTPNFTTKYRAKICATVPTKPM